MLKLLRSTSVRLALAFAGLFMLSSLVFAGIIWWRTADYMDRETQAVILSDTRAVADSLRDFGLAGAIDTVRERVGQHSDAYAIYLLTDPALRPLAGNVAAWPITVPRAPGQYQAEMVHGGELRATELLNAGLPGGFHLLVGRDVQDRVETRTLILGSLAWAAVASLALAAIGGFFVRRAALRRVELINRAAAAIVEGDLGRRVPSRESADEFDQLTRTVNRMLEQIETLIEGVRNVSNAIAHDLRTPLAELRTRLEDLLVRRPPPDEAFRSIEEAVGDIDRVIALFNALLRLAEIDSGVRRAGFRPVDLAEVAGEVAELYGPIAEAKGIDLACATEPGFAINGDPDLLAQAIGNLLDNAIKYAPPQGRVLLSLARPNETEIAVCVTDNGPGIPASERPHVTERFFRGDRSRGTSGVGLGLSLVAAVAKLHGGRLEFADAAPGLVASLVLPVSRG